MVEQKKKTKDWEQTHIIVYGQTFKGCSFIPRVWFTFWRLGLFARVSILNGTLEDDWTGPMELTSITVPWMKDILLPSSMDDDNNTNKNNKETKRQEAQDDTPPLQQDKSIVVVKRDQVLQDANGDPTILLDARGSSFAKRAIYLVPFRFPTVRSWIITTETTTTETRRILLQIATICYSRTERQCKPCSNKRVLILQRNKLWYVPVGVVYRLVVFMSRYWNADVITRIHFCTMGVGRNGPKLKHCPKFCPPPRRRRPPLLPNIRTNSSCCSKFALFLSWVNKKTKETLVV